MSTLFVHSTQADSMPSAPIDTDYVEFYVGNARQAAYFYRAAFGMSLVAYAGPETGQRDFASYVLQQGNVRFVLSTPLRSGSPVAEHLLHHGDGVKDVALYVDNATDAWRRAVSCGARSVREPFTLEDENGSVCMATIAAYGDIVHTFVARRNYHGSFLPRFQSIRSDPNARPVGLTHIDHVVTCVGWDELDRLVEFYEKVMGFRLFLHYDDKDISTEYSALNSKVMVNANGRLKFNINEPAKGRRKSQIEEFLQSHEGPGVQHLALCTNDIIDTVTSLRKNGVEFLTIPSTYYDAITSRVGQIDEPLETLMQLGILVDREDGGYTLQTFTRPVEDRPTLFYEIIQRKGSRSFGKGNFKALFESVEREQSLRGNL